MEERKIIYILTYVDDIMVTRSSDQEVSELIQALQAEFALKDLGDLHYFLGIEIKRSSTGTVLSQTKYTLELLSQVGTELCKLVASLMSKSEKLWRTEGKMLSAVAETTKYSWSFAILNTDSITQSDISYSINKVSALTSFDLL